MPLYRDEDGGSYSRSAFGFACSAVERPRWGRKPPGGKAREQTSAASSKRSSDRTGKSRTGRIIALPAPALSRYHSKFGTFWHWSEGYSAAGRGAFPPKTVRMATPLIRMPLSACRLLRGGSSCRGNSAWPVANTASEGTRCRWNPRWSGWRMQTPCRVHWRCLR